MFRRLLPPLLVVIATQVSGQALAEGALCPMTDDQSSCVRILACVGDKGRWFHGRGLGLGEGTLAGVMNDGVSCVGDWTNANAFGVPQARVTCDDGMEVTVLYFHQNEDTGTATGRGITNRDEGVQVWTGLHVLEYFKEGSPTDAAVLKCGAYDIPIS